MKINNFFSAASIVIVLLIGGCAHTKNTVINHESLVGYWYEVHQQDDFDGDVYSITNLKNDGTFYVQFRVKKNGRTVEEQTESGTWDLKEGNIHNTITTSINDQQLPEALYIADSYVILNISSNEMEYQHISTNTKFKANKVDQSFIIP